MITQWVQGEIGENKLTEVRMSESIINFYLDAYEINSSYSRLNIVNKDLNLKILNFDNQAHYNR